MRKLRNYAVCITVAVLSAAGMLASCKSHGGGSNGSGDVYTPAPAGSGGSSSSAGSTTATYTSYDSAGGYFNVNGGQYQTCTLTGNSTGGTITLSNGVLPNLTGSYGTQNGSVSLAAPSNATMSIEGYWIIRFEGVITEWTYSLFATAGFISLNITKSDGTKLSMAGGAAADATTVTEGAPVTPGSPEDPVNNTKWGVRVAVAPPPSSPAGYRFENGSVYFNGTYFGPYLVSRVSEGYKVCLNFVESECSTTNGNVFCGIGFFSFIVTDSAATETVDGWSYTEGYSYINNHLSAHTKVPGILICMRYN